MLKSFAVDSIIREQITLLRQHFRKERQAHGAEITKDESNTTSIIFGNLA
jgi:hypothetical protein